MDTLIANLINNKVALTFNVDSDWIVKITPCKSLTTGPLNIKVDESNNNYLISSFTNGFGGQDIVDEKRMLQFLHGQLECKSSIELFKSNLSLIFSSFLKKSVPVSI